MKKSVFPLVLGLSASLLVSQLSVQAQTGSIEFKVVPPASSPKTPNTTMPSLVWDCLPQDRESRVVQTYFVRNTEVAKTILEAIQKGNTALTGLTINENSTSGIVLSGCHKQIKAMQRVIATLDLPRPGINLEMWGIQLSSSNPEELSKVLQEVNGVIAETQRLMQATYAALDRMAIAVVVDPQFKGLIENQLGYTDALDASRTLSMADMLMRIIAAEDPHGNANAMAKKIEEIFARPEYQDYKNFVLRRKQQPFGRFLAAQGLTYCPYGNQPKVPDSTESCSWTDPNNPDVGVLGWKDQKVIPSLDRINTQVELYTWRNRQALLDFALNYGDYISRPSEFDAYRLQQAAGNLDARLKPVVDAINLDVADLFIEPTLDKIQEIVRKHEDVEYAQVGKTSVASLNGIEAKVTSETVSGFNEPPPLDISKLLEDAQTTKAKVDSLVPLPNPLPPDVVPTNTIVSLLAAASKDTSRWRTLTAGTSIKITPNILRNSTSAELQVDLNFGPNIPGTAEEADDAKPPKVRPLSRIEQHNVNTSIYVDTFDIFALSTFNSQITKDGGRSYIPVVGTIWQGIFSGIPGFGELFSWKNDPQNIYHQSLILTNSFIVPTAMGLGVLYQTGNSPLQPYQKCIAIHSYLQQNKGGATTDNCSSYSLYRR
jgi:hypothetical protein